MRARPAPPSRPTQERKGVCRDFAHLAVAFCRCMNIPARYANGFLGAIGVPPDPSPMDYNAWFEVILTDVGSRWTRATMFRALAASRSLAVVREPTSRWLC